MTSSDPSGSGRLPLRSARSYTSTRFHSPFRRVRMSRGKPISLVRIEYAKAAEAYLRSLPPEHFMEATPQARQRKITLCSFDVINAGRPDIQLFNELLVQYRQ